jgi:DUF4097 and DUF4098 domain-containing protein YvlB
MNYYSKRVQQFTIALIGILFCAHSFAKAEIAQSLPSENVTNIAISNHSGSINVIGWNKDKISITGTLDDDVEKLIFEQQGAQVIIKVEYPSMESWSADGSHLTVFMPKSIRMKASSVSSDIDVSNLHGGVAVKTVSGNITAKDISQSVELNSVSGDIDSDDLAGKIAISAVSGDITDNDSSGRLEVNSVSGDVDIDSEAKEVFFNNVSGECNFDLDEIIELRIRTVSGNLKAGLDLTDKGLLKATTVSGDLAFDFQWGIDADFTLKSSVGGDINNQLTKAKAQDDDFGPGAQLSFQTGKGSAVVNVTTVSGNINVRN